MEACFIDDMDTILRYVANKNYSDPNLSVAEHNINRLIEMAIEHSALKCLKFLISLMASLKETNMIGLLLQKLLKRETD